MWLKHLIILPHLQREDHCNPGITALPSSSFQTLKTSCTLQPIRFPFVYDWVNLSFFSLAASRETDRKCKKITTAIEVSVQIDLKGKLAPYDDAGFPKRAAQIFSRWQSIPQRTFHQKESWNTPRLEYLSLHRSKMPRKLASADEFALYSVPLAKSLRWAEPRTARNSSCSRWNWMTSAGRAQQQGR